jgi:hypothetical protein
MPDGSNIKTMQDPAYIDMGPSMLAKQPVDSVADNSEPDEAWSIAYPQLESRLGQLRNWRYATWAYWSKLAEFFLPARYVFLSVANRMGRQNPVNDQIVDSTPVKSVELCAAGLLSGLMSPYRPWFTLAIGLPWIELDAEGKAWLEDTQEKAYTVLSESNFYDKAAQVMKDVTTFATSPMIIYEDDADVIRCYVPAAGEYYLGLGSRLSVDTLYRDYTYTIAQIVGAFRIENCPEQVVTLWNAGQLDTEMVVAHAIEPNFAYSKRDGSGSVKIVPATFKYKEVYWLKGQNTPKPLSLAGFNEAPFMASRWATVSNEAYGRPCPCMTALGDAIQIQIETRRKAEYIEKGVRPPMLAHPSLKNEPNSIIPGQVTFADTSTAGLGFRPVFQVEPQWVKVISDDIEMVKARLESTLLVDLFMAITRMEGVQPRNELELTQRNMERLQELGPFVNLFQNEFAGPALQRVIGIMLRKGMLKPLPKSLQNIPLKINYVSVMRLAQLSLESVAMKDVFATGGQMSLAAHNAGLPDPLRIINLDDAFRHYADINNFPETALFTVEQVQANDKTKAQASQAAAMPGDAMAGVQAAKALSETPLGGDSALSALLGQHANAPTPAPGQVQ